SLLLFSLLPSFLPSFPPSWAEGGSCLIYQKQKEREEREKRETIEREKQRRKQGQELLLIRQKLQEDEMKKLAEERRREKMEEKLAKQRVREKIERDKAERAKKFGCSSATQASPVTDQMEPMLISSPSQELPVKREYDQCKIQVRLLDGTSLTHTFKAKEQLAAVRLYVELNRKDGGEDPFHLLTSFPRRVFTEEDMEKPLQELGEFVVGCVAGSGLPSRPSLPNLLTHTHLQLHLAP
uniref:UBX domain-containing protein n=1 Tax=Pseudonaja textilis TaxID=8673 RepID=A0A670ZID7_PSETE